MAPGYTWKRDQDATTPVGDENGVLDWAGKYFNTQEEAEADARKRANPVWCQNWIKRNSLES